MAKRRVGEKAKRREDEIRKSKVFRFGSKLPKHFQERRDWLIAGLLFLGVFFLTLFTSNAYGPTYDEPHYVSAGMQYAAWWGKVFTGDFSVVSRDGITQYWHFNHEHPPLQKVASGISQAVFGNVLPGLEAVRLPSALWFTLVVGTLYLFLVNVWGRSGALFSALSLAFLPRFFAHAHLLALDIAVAAWFFITVALMAVALERDSWKWTVAAGIAFGLALDAKLNAFFLPILLIPWGLIWHRSRWPKLIAGMVIGPVFFFLSWPWLWIAPVTHLREYLAFHSGHAAYNVWYLGKLYQLAPWHYPFVITAVTTPIVVLLLAMGGIVLAWPRRGLDSKKALLLLGLIVTLVPNALPNTPKYNGERLFLPAFPFLMALSGGAFAWILTREKIKQIQSKLIPIVLGIAMLAFSIRGLIALHPYQLAYYNELVGGTRGATDKGFETIYWGQVYQDCVGQLNALSLQNPKFLVIPKGVIYLLDFQQQTGALRSDVRFTGDEAEASQVDGVMFQMMQSEFSDLAWALVKNEKPSFSIRTDGAPVWVLYSRDAVARVLERLNSNSTAPAPSSSNNAKSEMNIPTR